MADTLLSILQIIWIDLLLSGDNAVVIALACRSLPPHQRRLGVLLGAGAAVGLRILFALIISPLLALPYLRLAGGILLIWIAVKLVRGEDAEHDVEAADSLWRAVRTIAIADAVMSLDNVVAIAAASHGNPWLFTFGLVLSVPLIIAGSTLIMGIIARFPIFVWAGAALLGWIAGEMIATDPFVLDLLWDNPGLVVHGGGTFEPTALLHYGAAGAGALFVLLLGAVLARSAASGAERPS